MTNPATIELPYGAAPLTVALPGGAIVADPPPGRPGESLARLLQNALDRPISAPRLEDLAAQARSVVVIVSDGTRDDPRAALLAAVRERLPPGAEVTLAIANGTHPPRGPAALGLDDIAGLPVVDHDARDRRALVELGATERGTPVIVHRCLVEADLVVATGRIKPHYFAGFGAGAKALFPGLGENDAVRRNHQLKSDSRAVPGAVDDNPCRLDLEEAARMVPAPSFLLNAICDADGHPRHAVAGDLVAAFRRGAELARPLFAVRARPASTIVVSDHLPLTASLYQASKLVATAAPLLEDGGTIVLAAACPEGIGPVDTVNRGIYELGLAPRLPAEHRIVLVSELPRSEVDQSYCDWAPTVESALTGCGEKPLFLPRAGISLVERAT